MLKATCLWVEPWVTWESRMLATCWQANRADTAWGLCFRKNVVTESKWDK